MTEPGADQQARGDPSVFPPMPFTDMLKQPPETWRCVERGIVAIGRSLGAAKMAGIGHSDIVRGGWLRVDPALIERLHAWDIPVGRLFTACAIAARPR